jgi:hypothetical protein
MGGSPHGTACAEIVYDMAPGATLYLSKVSTTVELANAVNDLITAGAKVISMSLGWTLDGPGDGTGYLASIVANARANGILFVNAAGNEAEVHWSGLFSNDGSGNHLWASGQNINYFGPGHSTSCFVIPAGYPIVVGLHWDDWTAVNQDYDLRLYRLAGSSWSLVTGSYNRQAGSYPTPEEFIGIYAPSSACYGVVVTRYSATRNVCLSLDTPKMQHLDQWVTGRSLSFPADSPNAMTVGAVNVISPYALEPYSSRGPTFGPGGSCSGGATKPDIAGYANVSTVSYGVGVFNGTSAATPHVAGAAALVKEAYPDSSVSELQTYLENNAIDLGTSGKDNLYGAGRLYLGVPPPAPPSESLIYLPLIMKNFAPPPPPPPGSKPVDGHWTGTTNRSQPMSFDVSSGGTLLNNFKLKTDFQVGPCSGTIETTILSSRAITNNQFNGSSGSFSFSGQFNTPTSASGTYAYVNHSIPSCGNFTQSGTWTANAP